jgi:hypothetical protein
MAVERETAEFAGVTWARAPLSPGLTPDFPTLAD